MWQIYNKSGELVSEAEVLVLANAYECTLFQETNWLPLEKVRGQVLSLKETEKQKN